MILFYLVYYLLNSIQDQ